MELIIELLFELIFEGALEVSKNKKVSKWIRYPLIAFIVLLFVSIIALISFLALIFIKENILISIILLAIDIAFIVGVIVKIKKYKKGRQLKEE